MFRSGLSLGAAAADFATNRGSGGNFSITGTLVEASGPRGTSVPGFRAPGADGVRHSAVQ